MGINSMKIICLVLLLASFVSANNYYVEETPVDTVVDFLKGMFEALNEKHKFQHVVTCIKGSGDIIKDFVELWNLIKNFDSSKIVELVRHVVSTAWKTYNYVTGCKGALDELINLGKAFINVNIVRLVSTIVWNIKTILNYVTDLIHAANGHDAGKALGHLIYMLFLDGYLLQTDFTFHEFVRIIEGFFAELLNDTNAKNITACLEMFPELYEKFLIIIRRLKEINIHNIGKLVEIVTDLFKIIVQILEVTKPCCKVPGVIDKMIHKFTNVTLHDLAQRLGTFSMQLFLAFTSLVTALTNADYVQAGRSIGKVVFYLVYNGVKDDFYIE